jgi:flagellar biosynthesis/type III secretory pathway M-ring protein FliF/YscJ
LDDKQKENKFAIVLSGIAGFISLLAGIFGGRGFGKILLTLILSGIIFYAIGFGLAILLRKLVPEIFEDEGVGSTVDATVEDDDDDEQREVVEYEDNELDGAMEDADDDDNYLVDKTTIEGGKDGKVTIKTPEGVLEEDPETVAKAIRTMMKKDE